MPWEFASDAAWPVAAIIIAFMLRKQIQSVIPLVRKVKAGGVEVHLGDVVTPELALATLADESEEPEGYVERVRSTYIAYVLHTTTWILGVILGSGGVLSGDESVALVRLFAVQRGVLERILAATTTKEMNEAYASHWDALEPLRKSQGVNVE